MIHTAFHLNLPTYLEVEAIHVSQLKIRYFYHHWVDYGKAAVSVLLRTDHGKSSSRSLGDDIASFNTKGEIQNYLGFVQHRVMLHFSWMWQSWPT